MYHNDINNDNNLLHFHGANQMISKILHSSLVILDHNFQIKKLVYVYLTRYAEEQQDLALLSISTFQRALKVYLEYFSY